VEFEELKNGAKPLQALDGVDKDYCASRKLEQEVVQEDHLHGRRS